MEVESGLIPSWSRIVSPHSIINRFKSRGKKLIYPGVIQSLQTRLEESSSLTRLFAIPKNLVDRTRPTLPIASSPFFDYPIKYSGETTLSKLDRIRTILSGRVASPSSGDGPGPDPIEWAYVLPALPSVAWLLNIRCEGDIPSCPVGFAYLALTRNKCVLFTRKEKVEDEVIKSRFEEEGIQVREYGVEEVGKFVKEMVKDDGGEEKQGVQVVKRVKIWTSRECSWALSEACKPVSTTIQPTPWISILCVILISGESRCHLLPRRGYQGDQKPYRTPRHADCVPEGW